MTLQTIKPKTVTDTAAKKTSKSPKQNSQIKLKRVIKEQKEKELIIQSQ